MQRHREEERYSRKRPYEEQEKEDDKRKPTDAEMESDSGRGTKRTREYNDLDPNFDRHGHPASNKLFLDKLPSSIKEETIQNMFQHFGTTLVSIQLGNKELKQVYNLID
jgi:hypothetical protein